MATLEIHIRGNIDICGVTFVFKKNQWEDIVSIGILSVSFCNNVKIEMI
jgi:hypothetical protein